MKDVYEDTWVDSEKKEHFVKWCLQHYAKVPVHDVGFGAGSTERIEGASGQYGHEKAAPDLSIPGTPIRIEVTGPLKPLPKEEPLLINLNKVRYAQDHPDVEYWVAHVNGVTKVRKGVRMFKIDKEFERGIYNGMIVKESFQSRGIWQTMWSVPSDHHIVVEFDDFLRYTQTYDRRTV